MPEAPEAVVAEAVVAEAVDGEPAAPSMFGPYRLEELIGRGGMGEVHRAYDTARERVVALKRLPPPLATDPVFQARFRAEAALAARLHEPHVIPVHDFGEIDGQLYIDMRLVDGPDLAALLKRDGSLPPQRVVDIVTQVAAALDAAHAAGLVHRDIKPGNILVVASADSTSDFVYVADFGIARAVDGSSSGSLTATGTTVGSLDYVAPERFGAGHGDPRSDVYALGCVLYEALTAAKPFPVEGLPGIIYAHLNTPPPAPTARCPDLPAALDAVVARAMAKEPDDRYLTAGALAADARRALVGGVAGEPWWQIGAVLPLGDPELPPPSEAGAGAAEPDRTAPPVAWSSAGAPPHDTAVPAAPELPATPLAAVSDPADTGIGATPVGAGAVAPGAVLPAPRRRRTTFLAAAAIVAVMVSAVTATQLIRSPVAVAQVMTEPLAAIGANPFMPSVSTGAATTVDPVLAGGVVSGGATGLYGGTLNDAACDPARLVSFLQGHPDKAAAWADVEGIATDGIPDYVRGLTPVVLRADTAVTNHGFADGEATTLASVLQTGTAVLVDSFGMPRARCYCGNPLTPPGPTTPAATDYTGVRWSGFDPAKVVFVEPAPVPVTHLTLYDPVRRKSFDRPVGGNGHSDRPTTRADPSAPTAVPSAPSDGSAGSGTEVVATETPLGTPGATAAPTAVETAGGPMRPVPGDPTPRPRPSDVAPPAVPDPPVPDPPVKDPPVLDPPVKDPPVKDPLVLDPPVKDPPVKDPVVDPPVPVPRPEPEPTGPARDDTGLGGPALDPVPQG